MITTQLRSDKDYELRLPEFHCNAREHEAHLVTANIKGRAAELPVDPNIIVSERSDAAKKALKSNDRPEECMFTMPNYYHAAGMLA